MQGNIFGQQSKDLLGTREYQINETVYGLQGLVRDRISLSFRFADKQISCKDFNAWK